MEHRNEYGIYFDIGKRDEKAILEFFLANADTLRLTITETTEIGFCLPPIKRIGGYSDPVFLETLKNLQDDYIKNIINSEKYNDITQPCGQKFEHYFYRLSGKIKSGLKESSLLFNSYDKFFYGFEDPTFYKEEQILGSVISHEPIIIMYLTVSEKERLTKEGVSFTE